MKLTSKTINYTVDTIEQLLLTTGTENDTVIVTDENRGGVFVYREDNSSTNNGGTIFNGWTRQYSGAVNVKWFGAVENTDSTDAIQTAIDNSTSLMIPDGIFIASGLTITSDIMIIGNGTIKKKADVDGRLITVTAKVIIKDITLDGSNTQPTNNYLNDILVLGLGSSSSVIDGITINGSAGGGISIYNSSDNTIRGCKITNVYDNGILIANVGSDRNIIDGNIIDGTTAQNCIFTTAKSDSTPTTDYIYDNKIINNTCKNAGDTAIESGQHSYGTLVSGNIVYGDNNPPLLMRDVKYNVFSNNIVYSNGCIDCIAVVPQNESGSNSYYSSISENTIIGYGTRSAIYLGAFDISVQNNTVKYDGTIDTETFTTCTKSAILIGGGLKNILINGNKVESCYFFIDFNYEFITKTVENIHIISNTVNFMYDMYNMSKCTLKSIVSDGNKFTTIKNANYFTDIVIYGIKLNDFIDVGVASGGASLSGLIKKYNYHFANFNKGTIISKLLNLPTTQYGAIILIEPVNTYGRGTIDINFPSGAEYCMFDTQFTTLTTVRTSTNLNANGTGFTGWSIFLDGSSQILIQRRGSNTTAQEAIFQYTYK